MNETVTIGITMGDPAGVGPELSLLAAARATDRKDVRTVIIGDLGRLEKASAILAKQGRLDSEIRLHPVQNDEAPIQDVISVLDLGNVPDDLPFGEVAAISGRAAFDYVERAVALAMKGQIDAICTAPIHKKAWELAGVRYPGHTEALAKLSGSESYAMMLKNQRLRVVHVTTHIPFSAIIPALSVERIVGVVKLTDQYLQQLGMHDHPIALAGLNPHAGDGGLFGTEEANLLAPAVQAARAEGLNLIGPLPADTVFARGAAGEFAAVIALYHDQGHIAIKMLGIDTGVNQTIGLPLIRTSVDHGTAFDIAGRGIVHDESMRYALEAAIDDAMARKKLVKEIR